MVRQSSSARAAALQIPRQLGLGVESAFESRLSRGRPVGTGGSGGGRGPCGRPVLKMWRGLGTKSSQLSSDLPQSSNAQVGAPRPRGLHSLAGRANAGRRRGVSRYRVDSAGPWDSGPPVEDLGGGWGPCLPAALNQSQLLGPPRAGRCEAPNP